MFENNNKKIVIDTNILVSSVLFPESITAKVLHKAMTYWEIYISQTAINEFLEVISRNKFDKYFLNRPNGREIFTENFLKSVIIVEPTEKINDCQDPKDNQFLEIAVCVNAVYLVTGDKKDLLSMNPYRGIEIITAREFLER